MSASVTPITHFDLHVRGVGYVNRVREVEPKKGPRYLAASVSALRGDADNVEYTRFDCRVVGADAIKVIRDLMEPANDQAKKVLIGFSVGDIYAEHFTLTKGDRAGQTASVIKGRLLKVAFAKVDGVLVYTAPKAEPQEEAAPPAEPLRAAA